MLTIENIFFKIKFCILRKEFPLKRASILNINKQTLKNNNRIQIYWNLKQNKNDRKAFEQMYFTVIVVYLVTFKKERDK